MERMAYRMIWYTEPVAHGADGTKNFWHMEPVAHKMIWYLEPVTQGAYGV